MSCSWLPYRKLCRYSCLALVWGQEIVYEDEDGNFIPQTTVKRTWGHQTGRLCESNYEARKMSELPIHLALVVGKTIVGDPGRTPEQQLTGLFPKHNSRFCPFCTNLIISSITSSFRTSPKACIGMELGVLAGLSSWRPVSGIASAGMLRGELGAQGGGKDVVWRVN